MDELPEWEVGNVAILSTIGDAPHAWTMVNALRQRSQVGSSATVRAGLRALIAESGVDELMFFGTVYDTEARLRSYEMLAEIAKTL